MQTKFDEQEWEIEDPFGRSWCFTIGDGIMAASPEDAESALRMLLSSAFQDDVVRDVDIANDLMSIYETLERASNRRALPHDSAWGTPRLPPGMGTTVSDALIWAVYAGRLRIVMLEEKRLVDVPMPPDAEGKEGQTTNESGFWLELVLQDTAGDPVPRAAYRVHLSNGGVREGVLNADGKARLGDLPPGACEAEFPDFDGADWSK